MVKTIDYWSSQEAKELVLLLRYRSLKPLPSQKTFLSLDKIKTILKISRSHIIKIIENA